MEKACTITLNSNVHANQLKICLSYGKRSSKISEGRSLNLLFYSKHSTYTAARVGGAETSHRLTAEMLSQIGHNVCYLTSFDHKKNTLKVIRKNGVKVVFYPLFQNLFFQRFRKNIFGKTTKDKWLEKILREVILKNDIDLIYVHYDLEVLNTLLRIRHKLNFKIVMRMAGLKWYEEIKNNMKTKEDYEYVFNSVDSINYVSFGLKKLCDECAEKINFNLSPRNEFVADIGTKIKAGIKEISRKDRKGCLKLVVATRFSSYQKRQDILVEAIKILKGKFPLEVLMIGDGPEKKNIENKILEYDLNDIIKIRAFVNQKELWFILHEADLLCHPCDYEGLSKIIVESMAIGLPVLVSDVVPLNEYIKDKYTGYLVSNTPIEWAKKIESIFSNFELSFDIAKEAQKYALDVFNTDKNVKIYEEQFSQILIQN